MTERAAPSKALMRTQPLLPRRPAQGRALVIVIAIMACLAGLSLLFSRGADRLDKRWVAQLDQTATVQILIGSEDLRDSEMGRAETVLNDALPRARVRPFDPEEARALLEPWLGETVLPDDLPIPGLIEVQAREALPVDTLNSAFEAAGLRAIIDDHSRFSGALKTTVDRLVWLGLVLIGLTLTAAIFVSTFGTRARLAAQRDIIHVLVQAGASDWFIARLFIFRSAWQGLIGGAFGCSLAVGGWLLLSLGPARGTIGWRGLTDIISDVAVLCVLVLAFLIFCAMAAGSSALRQLAEERRLA